MAELVSGNNADIDIIPIQGDTINVGVPALDAYARGEVDFNFFAGVALPDICISALPYFYIACAQLIINRDKNDIGKILRFALGLPRGHAKTTFVKILLAWLIAYNKVSFVLVVCATEPNAENIVADLNNIMSSPNMEALYGAWHSNLYTDNTSTKQCMYNGRPVTIMAKGARTALRGVNINNTRPDCIVCDDMQTKENDASPTESAALRTWFVATLLKVINPRGDRLIIYIGNMYSDKCILKQLQDSPGWISLITGAILADGNPLWPELHSLESLMESYLHDESLGEANSWFAEVMNDPRNAANSLLASDLHYEEPEYTVADGVFITIDPAGFRKTSDDNVIVVHEVHNNIGYVTKTDAGKYNPKEVVEIALARAFEYGASVIGIETVAYQQTLKFWVEYFINALGIKGIDIVELSPHGRSKEQRIRLFIQELLQGNYRHKTVEEKALFTWQAMAYKLGKKDNKDDILDAQSYGIDMRTDYWHLITNNKVFIGNNESSAVVVDNTPF
jgi:hypothetical protein